MSSPTHNCCHPKQQQPQTTAGELASVMQELRQRFNKPTNPNDVPVQPVQKKEQKKQRSYLQRRNAFRRQCKKRLGWDIFSKIEMCSETELLSDWNKFPEGKLCDCSERFLFWPDCFYGRQHTKSCPSLFVYSPRLKKLAVKLDPETPDFLKNKSKREAMEKLDGNEKSPKHCDEAIDKPDCSDQHLAKLDPKQQQLQTTADLTSVMLELRQRFDNRTTAKDVPTQSVQKEEQKEQLSFFQRREAFWEECLKRLGWGIIERIQMRSAEELLNDRKMFPKEEWCDRPSSQYNCSYGCQHTKSCEAFFEFSPEYMKHIAKVEAITGHRGPTYLTKKSKQENVEECDADEKSSEYYEGGNDRPSCSSRRLIARSYEYLTPASLDAVTANFRSDRAASNLTSSSNDYFGQTSENFSLEPLLGSLEDINSTKTCPQTTNQRNYFLDEEWSLDFVSVGSSCVSLNTMEELDPEKWQLLEYSVRPFASFDDFFAMSSASSGNVFSPSTPVSVPTITRSASTGDFEDMESVPSSIQSSVSFLFSPPEARETVSLQTTIQKE